MSHATHPLTMPRPIRLDPNGHAARVADPRVAAALRRWVYGRVPAADVPDMVQNVLAALLPVRNPPATLQELIALGRRVLRHDLIDRYRHEEIVGEVEVRPLEPGEEERVAVPAPAWASDPLDVAKRARLIQNLCDRGELTEDDVHLIDATADAGYAAVASERDTTAEALRTRVHRTRKLARRRWATYVSIGIPALLLLLAVAYAVLHDRDQVALPPESEPASSP